MTAAEYLETEGEKNISASEYLESQEVSVTEKEVEKVEKQEEKSFFEDFADRLEYNAARLGTTYGDYLDETLGTEGIKGEFEKYLEDYRKEYEDLEEIESRAIVGGRPSMGKMAGEILTYGLPTARVGIIGQGVSSIPKTTATWGATDYVISKSLGYSDKEALDDAFVAGIFGAGFSGAAKAGKSLSKAADEGRVEMEKQAGGGPIPEEDFKYFNKDYVDDVTKDEAFPDVRDEYDVTKDIRDIADTEGTTFQKVLEDLPEDKIKEYSDYKKIESGVTQDVGIAIIKRNNPEMFKGVKNEIATDWLKKDNNAYQGLLADTQSQLKQDLNIDRGIKIGESETLFDPTFPDDSKALSPKKRTKVETPKAQQFDFKALKTELDSATTDFNKLLDSGDTKALDLAEKRLTQAMRQSKAYSIETKIDGTLDDMYNTGVSPSKIDKGYVKEEFKLDSFKDRQKQASRIKTNEAVDSFIEQNKIEHAEIDDLYSKNGDGRIRPMLKGKLSGVKSEKDLKDGYSEVVLDDGFKFKAKGKVEEFNPRMLRALQGNEETMKRINDILDLKLDVKYKLIDDMPEYQGYYDPTTKELVLAKSALANPDIVLHELVHSKLTDALVANKDAKITKELDTIRYKLMNEMQRKDLYVFSDKKGEFDEFLAESLSSKVYRDKLKKVRYSGKERTLYEKVIDYIFKKLGIKRPNRTMFDRLEDVEKELMKNKSDEMRKASVKPMEAKEFDSKINKMSNYLSDVLDNPNAEGFRKLHQATTRAFDTATRYKDGVISKMDKHYAKYGSKAKALDKELYNHLVKTDYESIRDIKDSGQANTFIKENKAIYQRYAREINVLAQSMRDSGKMNNIHWRGNGYAIMRKYGDVVNQETIDTIEKLASIKAMKQGDWDYVATMRKKDPELFETSMRLMNQRTEMSKKQFADNPHDRIKGYVSEVYDNLDMDFSYRKGALPLTGEKKVKGEVTTDTKNLSIEESEKLAIGKGEGLLLKEVDGMVESIGTRKVASESYKVNDLGKVESFKEVMGETLSTSVRKTNVNSYVIKKLDEVIGESNLFNGDGDKFVGLSKEERNLLPKQIADRIHSIDKDYKHQLLGNYEVGYKNGPQAVKIAQLIMKDVVGQFKEGVVLKNPTSYVNNLMFNVAIGVQNGINPKNIWKYHTEAIGQYKQMRSIQKDIAEAIIDGRDYKVELERLKKLDLYKYSKEGLAMSVISDITSTPTFSKRITEKGLKKLVESIVGKGEVADNIGSIASNLYLSPSAQSGKFLLDMFTRIDVSGRYMLTKHNIDNGMKLKDAVNKTNSVFGDLDKLTPEWVQGITEFGAIPFGSWFYRISGGLTKNVKDNALKAIALGGVLYGAEEFSGRRTESYNPMLTIFNTPLDMVGMSPYLNIENTVERAAIPIAYEKIQDPERLLSSRAF